MNKTGNHNLKKQEINIYREIQRNTEMVVISRIITSRTMVDIHSLQTILIRITITMLHQMTLCPLVTLMILKKY